MKPPRVFRYNSVELEDPGPEHDPVDVRNLYAATYPEIVSAGIDGPEEKDGKHVYTFRKAVGTKGGVVETIKAGSFPRQGGHKGKRVFVCFHHDTSKKVPGVIVRDDVEHPYETFIALDDGRYVRSVECQYALA